MVFSPGSVLMELPGRALWAVFADGARVTEASGWTTSTRTLDAGPLILPAGRIVASDPLLNPWREPFSVRVAPGAYPVFLAIVRRDVMYPGRSVVVGVQGPDTQKDDAAAGG
jgi:hypothetical protein